MALEPNRADAAMGLKQLAGCSTYEGNAMGNGKRWCWYGLKIGEAAMAARPELIEAGRRKAHQEAL